MDTSLLRTKLHRPSLSPKLVQRPQIVRRLTAALDQGCRVTLVSAPAGYGKTTLAVQWLEELDRPVAWLSLDPTDNHPAVFWHYIIAALQTAFPGFGRDAWAALGAEASLDLHVLLVSLINQLDASRCDGILVLDDFHTIDHPAIQASMGYFLEHMPTGLHLVLLSRWDPPVGLPRLRARGEVHELGAEELRFGLADAAWFVRECKGLDLCDAEVAALNDSCEGWATGLQLASISLQGRIGEDRESLISTFRGSSRHLEGYLLAEVYAQQPQNIQTFLRRTSILTQLCASLSEQVCDIEAGQGQRVLDALEEGGLFVIPLDAQRGWFRYHHLFRSFLQRRLSGTEPQVTPALHRRASDWFADHALLDDAIEHALRGRDLERAAALTESAAPRWIGDNELQRLLSWMNRLPQHVPDESPTLLAWYGIALARAEQFAELSPVLERLAQVRVADRALLEACAAALQGYQAVMEADYPRAIQSAKLALSALKAVPEDALWMTVRTTALATLAIQRQYPFQLAQLKTWADQALVTSLRAHDAVVAAESSHTLAVIAELRAEPRRAIRILTKALSRAVSSPGASTGSRTPLLATARLNSGIARMLCLTGAWDRATLHADRATEIYGLIGGWQRMLAHRLKAELLFAQGDPQTAYSMYRELEDMQSTQELSDTRRFYAVGSNLPLILDLLCSYPDDIHLRDRLEALVQEAESHNVPGYNLDALQPQLAMVLLAVGRGDEAARLSRVAAARCAERDIHLWQLWSLTAGAEARFSMGDHDAALDLLRQALAIAEPQGIVRLLPRSVLDTALLRAAVSQGIGVRFLTHVLAVYEPMREAIAATLKAAGPPLLLTQPLSELLSDRQLQVLRLLAAGLSSDAVASELVISVATARTHIRNIYAKLDVHTRAAAVSRAQRLGLI